MSSTSVLSEAVGREIDVSNLSHLTIWQDIVAANPNGTALISYHQKPTSYRWVGSRHVENAALEWTFEDLDRGARRLATTLNRISPINRRPLVCLVNNQAEWSLLFFAASYLHSPLVPINPKCATRSDEVAHMIKLVQPGAIVAFDSVVASQLESSLNEHQMNDIPIKLILARSDAELTLKWHVLGEIMMGELTPPDTPTPTDPTETAVILFTSGTTSLPKPCAISSAQTANAAFGYTESRNIGPGHRFVQHLPNFHSYGIGWVLGFLLVGGTIIIPSESFEAQASLECIEKYRATHMSLVPTTAQAIIVHPAFGKTDISSLMSIDISGAGVLPSVVESCEAALQVPAGTSYGMTESPTTLCWPTSEGSVLRNGQVITGRPSRGVRVKICEPGSTIPIPRGQAGELHNGGVQVITEYMDPTVNQDCFYTDHQGNWIMTGDQAIMEDDGAVRICGRYKDIIIRGGENISPASIEALLQKAEGVYIAQVVGAPDEMAGEVPIAVIQTMGDKVASSSLLKDMASQALGPAFAPKMVLNLKTDLKLDDFPKTAAGKIRKVDLAVIVREYLKAQEGPAVDASAPTVDSLIAIWKRISGADSLTPESTLVSFADSLMMMQLSGTVKKELKKDVTVEDFKNCDRIQDQADLIDSKIAIGTATAKPKRNGPPTVKDVPYVNGDEKLFNSTKGQISAALAREWLTWDDVEDVMPLPDWDAIFAHKCRPQSWNLRWSYTAPVKAYKLESAVRTMLEYHPTLRSMTVKTEDETSLLVTVRANESWYNAAITGGHRLDKKEDLNNLLLNDPVLDNASLGGPLFRVHVASLADGTSGLVVIASHAICDMSMTALWLDDIVTILTGQEAQLARHASFTDYANAFHAHRNGLEASNGVKYWTSKLAGIGSLPESTYWPQQRAPEFFKGEDMVWRHYAGTKARPHERKIPLSTKRIAQQGIRRIVPVPAIAQLKSAHDVPIFMLVKSAIALLNAKLTHSSEAIFGTLNAARSWPFQSDYTPLDRETFTGNPLDVSGCTVEYVLDRVPVPHHQNIVEFMQAVTSVETQNSAFAHTPIKRIIDALRCPLSTTDTRSYPARERDSEAIISLIRRQSFNWLPIAPTAQSDPRGLCMEQMLTRMDNGLTITGFLAEDKKSVVLSFTWDAEHLTVAEAEAGLSLLAKLVSEMGDVGNWGLSVGEVLGGC